MYEQIKLNINDTIVTYEITSKKQAIDFIKRNLKDYQEALKVLSTNKKETKYLSRLTNKEIKEFFDLYNGMQLLKNTNTKTKLALPTFELEPTKENFINYYNQLKELGFAISTINTQVTKLRKQYSNIDVPSYEVISKNNLTQIRNKTKRMLNIKVSTKKVLELLNILKDSNKIVDKYLFVAIATGRRENEILKDINNFDFKSKNDYEILFRGQSKLKSRDKFDFKIPCLVNKNIIKEVLNDIHKYKEANKNEFEYLTDETKTRIFNGKINSTFKSYTDFIAEGYTKLLKPHNCRSIYALICNMYINQGELNELTYFSEILGHDANDVNSQNHYKLITVIKDIENIEGVKIENDTNNILYQLNLEKYKHYLSNLKNSKTKETYIYFIDQLKRYYKNKQLKFNLYHLSSSYKKLNYNLRQAIKDTFIIN